MRIRPQEPSDARAVRAVNEAAFGSAEEANLVAALRNEPDALVSLVAELDGRVVGHILFSPVTLLVREGLDRCRNMSCSAVVVLGHPAYYPRFGFVPARRYGIMSEYEVADEAFMLVELEPGSLEGVCGKVIYHEAFRGA